MDTCHMVPDCCTIFIINPEGGVYVHALPLLGSNSCRNQQQNSGAERSLSQNPACLGLGSDWSEGCGKLEFVPKNTA